MSIIPIIDLSDPQGPRAVADAIGRTCRETGFFLITGHGANREIVERGWQAARAFFDRPVEEKLTAVMPYPGYPYGYTWSARW